MLLLFIFLLFFGTLFTLFKLLSKALLEIKADFTHRETPELPNFDELKTNLLDYLRNAATDRHRPLNGYNFAIRSSENDENDGH